MRQHVLLAWSYSGPDPAQIDVRACDAGLARAVIMQAPVTARAAHQP